MSTDTLDRTAREALASACADVRDAGPTDAVDGVAPGLVARPADTDQVAEVLRAAAAHGLTVVPARPRHQAGLGHAADERRRAARPERARPGPRPRRRRPDRRRPRPGARLADVQARRRRRPASGWPLDETVPGASIGGSLATNASGPRRVAAGTARDLLIGITVVRADGVVAKAGGRVVKNVAGYDLGKLLIGSFGTLAVDHRGDVPAAPAAGRAAGGCTRARRRPGRGAATSSRRCVHAPGRARRDRGRLAADGRGHASPCCSRAATTASTAGAATVRVAARRGTPTESDEPPAGGATYPWDVAAAGDDRATRSSSPSRSPGCADVLAAAARGRRAAARLGRRAASLYAALAAGTPSTTVARGARPAARRLHRGTAAAPSWSTRRAEVKAGRRRVGAGARRST